MDIYSFSNLYLSINLIIIGIVNNSLKYSWLDNRSKNGQKISKYKFESLFLFSLYFLK